MKNAHAFLSPSFAHIGYKCPASALRSFQVKQRQELLAEVGVEFYGIKKDEEWEALMSEDTTLSDKGTALHTVFEHCLKMKLSEREDVRTYINVAYKKLSTTHSEDDFITDSLHRLVVQTLENIQSASRVIIESKSKMNGLPSSGTVDLAYLEAPVLNIEDLKTGQVEVDAKDNEQLMTYALNIYDSLSVEEQASIKTVRFKILGLRWDTPEWVIPVQQLLKWKTEVVLPAYIEAYSINPKAIAGKHCLYCDAKIHCAEYIDKLEGDLKKAHGLSDNATFDNSGFDDLSNDELVSLAKDTKIADNFNKEAKQELLIRTESFEPPDVKRMNGRKTIVWSKKDDEVVKALAKSVTNKEELYSRKLKPPKDLKKLIGEDKIEKISKTVTGKPWIKL